MLFDGSDPRLAFDSTLILHFRHFQEKSTNRCKKEHKSCFSRSAAGGFYISCFATWGVWGGEPKSPSDRPGSACLKRPGGSSGIQKSPRTPKTQEKPAKASKSTYKNRRGRKKPKKSRIKPAKTQTKIPADSKKPRKAG